MLSAGAYSFRTKSRLAISLSWVAGYVNVIALLHCGYVLSHQSGNTTHFAEALAKGWIRPVGIFGLMLGCFFLGSVGSGFLTELGGRRDARSKYTLPILAEVLLLSLFAIGVANTPPLPHGTYLYTLIGLAAMAMGLQNATITRISGAVVRTTHMTGVLTDIGLESVQLLLWYRDKLRGRQWTRARRVLWVSRRHPTMLLLLLLGSIYGSFILGIVAGVLAYEYRPALALVAPIVFLLWIIWAAWRKPIADVRELNPLDDPELRARGIVHSLLPPELGIYRLLFHASTAHQAPNFQYWVNRLPRRWRVVILALSPLTRLDSNAAIDLKGAIQKLHSQSRRLILCGINAGQYKVLDRYQVIDVIEPENICPDMEFAIARGISLLQELADGRPRRRHWDAELVDT
jgi:uncharacterized membrane protein YoaK (UPF0700 family)